MPILNDATLQYGALGLLGFMIACHMTIVLLVVKRLIRAFDGIVAALQAIHSTVDGAVVEGERKHAKVLRAISYEGSKTRDALRNGQAGAAQPTVVSSLPDEAANTE